MSIHTFEPERISIEILAHTTEREPKDRRFCDVNPYSDGISVVQNIEEMNIGIDALPSDSNRFRSSFPRIFVCNIPKVLKRVRIINLFNQHIYLALFVFYLSKGVSESDVQPFQVLNFTNLVTLYMSYVE